MIPELDAQPDPNASKLLIRFNIQSVPDKKATAEAGHPKFKDVEYIEIRVPGQRDSVHRPVRPEDQQRYAAQYAAWKANTKGGGEVGMPLSELPGMPASIIRELEHFNCKTVEQLAGMSDAALKNVGPYLEYRRKAQAYLEAAKGNAPLAKLAEENEQLRRRLEALEMAATKSEAKKVAQKSA